MCTINSGRPFYNEPSSPNFTIDQNLFTDSEKGVPFAPSAWSLGTDSFGGVTVKDPTTPQTQLSNLDKHNYPKTQDPVTVGFTPYSQISFEQANTDLSQMPAPVSVPQSIPDGWLAVNQGLNQVINDLETARDTLRASQGWQGQTYNTVIANVNASIPILKKLAASAGGMSILSQAFGNTMSTTWNDIVPNYPVYAWSMHNFQDHADEIKQQFDSFARKVMKTYQDNMITISAGMPVVDDATPAQVSPIDTTVTGVPTGPGGVPGLGGAVGGPGLGGGGSGPGGMPAIPSPANLLNTTIGPQGPTTPQIPAASQIPANLSTPTTSSNSAPTSALQGALGGLGPLAEPAAIGAQSVGQLANVAGQAGHPGALNAAHSLGKLPLAEGTLAKGLNGKGGAGGTGGGKGAIGIGNNRVGAPFAAAAGRSGADRVVAAGSRAGLVNTMGGAAAGAPGAGAPAAGHQGAAQGAQYQPSKVLRRKKNGEDLIGDTDAVVAVLGEPTRPEAAKPDSS
jgi:hypothetical protein